MKIIISCLNSKFVHASLSPWCLLVGLRQFSAVQNEALVMESTINGDCQVFARKIADEKPQIVAFSCYIWNITKTLEVCRIIKELHGCKIVLGGPEVAYRQSDVLNKYPHEFSGGQRQRIAIARALILEPEILILDEPTSALDVTIQKQIISLLTEIQNKRKISYIFISHDMAAIKAMADRIAVMKDGKIIEIGDSASILNKPKETYTKELINAAL